jgi:hypothetical protein
MITNLFTGRIEMGPNLDMVPRANKAYEDMEASDAANADNFSLGHRNFIKDAVYFLYTSGREREAQQWFDYMKKRFPKDPGVPRDKSLEQYCIDRVSEDVNETSHDRVQAIVQGMLTRGFMKLAVGDEDDGISSIRFAERVHANFTTRVGTHGSSEKRMSLTGLDDMKRVVLLKLCEPNPEINPTFQNALRSRLKLPADFGMPKTNAPPAKPL